MLVLVWERNLCENLPLALIVYPAGVMKSLGAYVSIGLRKELMEEPTIDLDSSPYECQPVIMLLLVSMQDGAVWKPTYDKWSSKKPVCT